LVVSNQPRGKYNIIQSRVLVAYVNYAVTSRQKARSDATREKEKRIKTGTLCIMHNV